MSSRMLLPDETNRYFDEHPEAAERRSKAEQVYATFGRYLNLTQARIVIRESGASTSEADSGATLLRTDI